MQLMMIKEARDFLKSQRKIGRKVELSGVDEDWVRKEKGKRKRKMKETEIFEREKESHKNRIAKDKYELSSSSSSQLDQSPFRSPVKKSCRGSKAVVINAEVAVALDRSQMSNRRAMAVLAPVASGVGSNVEELSLSASTIHRHRRIHSDAKAAEIKESFSPTVSLTVHWDVKLMPALTNGKVVDRLPILVSGWRSLQAACCPGHRWKS